MAGVSEVTSSCHKGVNVKSIRNWTPNDITTYIEDVCSLITATYASKFIIHDVDGEAFLLLTTKVMTENIGISRAAATEIYGLIFMIKEEIGMGR